MMPPIAEGCASTEWMKKTLQSWKQFEVSDGLRYSQRRQTYLTITLQPVSN